MKKRVKKKSKTKKSKKNILEKLSFPQKKNIIVKKNNIQKISTSTKKDYKKYIVMSLLILILITLIVIYIRIPYNCKYDEDCFNQRFESCKRTDFYKVLDGDTYNFEVKGNYKGDCLLNIRMVLANEKSDFFVKENMVGKGMLCRLPKGDFASIQQINNSLDYCTGPLKEAMLEQMIKNLFEIIVNNIKGITQQMETKLNEVY